MLLLGIDVVATFGFAVVGGFVLIALLLAVFEARRYRHGG